jgi:predicted NAD/FAD-binding protein
MSNRKLVIVGAGAAGVFSAYRAHQIFGNQYQIILLEASDRVGGNTCSTQVTYGGQVYNIDCGAQFFYKNPQPNYDSLLQFLGLEGPPPKGVVFSAPAGFSVWDHAANHLLFWVPGTVDGFMRYTTADWDRIIEFGLFLAYAVALDSSDTPDWTLSVDDWLQTLPLLTDSFKQTIIKPFLFQFVSLPLARIGQASALYAITYLARNLFGGSAPPGVSGLPEPSQPVFVTYQSQIGLDGILKYVLQSAQVTPQLSTAVKSVARQGAQLAVTTANGNTILANDVIFSCDPHAAAAILAAGGTADPALIALLNSLEYGPLPISMQKDGACWMPDDPAYWESINTVVDGGSVSFSAWFGPLRKTYGADQQIPVFKSWGAPPINGAACSHQFLAHQHSILLPTTEFVAARDQLPKWQGRDGIFFTGGWTQWFDCQESALNSATQVVEKLPGKPSLLARPRIMTVDRLQQLNNLGNWLALVAQYAPSPQDLLIRNALDTVFTA